MRVFKKILRGVFWALGILVTVLILSLFVLLKWPETIVNERVLKTLAALSGRFGAVVSWREAQIHVLSPGLLHKKLDLTFEDFCFNFSKNKRQGCIQKLRVAAEAAWLKKGFQIIELGPFTVEGGKILLHQEEAKEIAKEEIEKKLELELPDLVLPNSLRQTIFREISVDLPEVVVWREGEVILSGKLQVQGISDERGRLNKLQTKIHLDSGFKSPSGDLTAELVSPSFFHENDWLLSGETDLVLEPKTSAQASFQMHPAGPSLYMFHVEGSMKQRSTLVEARMDVHLKEREWKGTFSGTSQGFARQVQKLKADGCGFSLQEIAELRDHLKFSLDCPILVDLTPLQVPSATFKHLVTIPYNLDLRVKTDLTTSFYPSPDKPVTGTLNVILNTVSQELLTARGSTATRFSGVPSRYPQGWTLSTKLDLNVVMPRFQRLVKSLERSAFPIFAPLNELDGGVELKLAGDADLARERGKIPIIFTTRLRSAEQSLDTDGKGEVNYQLSKNSSAMNLNLDLSLSDLKIVMPRFGYTSLPALFPDARFYDPRKVKTAPSAVKNFHYQIQVHTPPEHPARFVSNLAKEDIPLHVNLLMTEKKLDGILAVGSTQLDFFRRNAHVERFKLDLEEPRNKSIVDGLVRVKYADYSIDIIVVGAVERPKIVFQSDPPLDQEQILSVLIYGRTFEQLNTDNASSVSAVSAAVADRAIALGSLFLLASSPIESIRYDPQSKAFSAKVKLAQGTSLELGTREGKTQELGFRKNLKGNWLIRTYIENESETEKQKGGAFLEWYKRY